MLSGSNDLWGLLRACCIVSKKHTGFIPEILPACRCVVSAQQQCFAKLQSEMNQLARPPACQPNHPAKTNDRGPLLLFHNSSYTSSSFITFHKYTWDKSEEGGTNPTSPALSSEVNDKKTNLLQGLNPDSISLQYFYTLVLSYSTDADILVRFGRMMEAQKSWSDVQPNAAKSLAFAGKFEDLLIVAKSSSCLVKLWKWIEMFWIPATAANRQLSP